MMSGRSFVLMTLSFLKLIHSQDSSPSSVHSHFSSTSFSNYSSSSASSSFSSSSSSISSSSMSSSSISSSSISSLSSFSCELLVSCDLCMSERNCVWCRDPTFNDTRCGTREEFEVNSTCTEIEDPNNEVIIITEETLTPDATEHFVQISPQRVKLRLRVGKEEKITFHVAQSLHYPVDLYYLMDLSNSMSDDRDNIVKLGGELAQTIENITRNYQIGFGSFVDKEVMPFISMVTDDNCQASGCPKPYSFQHQMSLTRDAIQFADRVRKAPISGNIDNPEGGLDALMQVMVCGDRIGWREEARRVIIYTTDQSLHIAGDGKLGGLVEPNDGLCHLNRSGFYTHSTLLDYPSLGHINHVARSHHFNVIWAVSSQHLDLYSKLTSLITLSYAGAISNDSSNVVSFVKDMYEKITTTIRMEDTSTSAVSISYSSTCNKPGDATQEICEDIPLGTPVPFTASITLNECSKESQWLAISPVGLEDELVVEIEPICECECKKEGNPGFEYTSEEYCNSQGNSVCGECQCFGEFFGERCNCTGGEGVNQVNPEATCRSESSNSLCSGRGSCICGRCVCDQKEDTWINGTYCECDNSSCNRSPATDLMCGGRGQCVCGSCQCQEGWSGDSCDCKEDQSGCRSPLNGKECSGHGECVCGKCVCRDDKYSGDFCEVCETCPGQCQALRDCVECLAFGSGNLVEQNEGGWPQQKQFCEEHCSFEYEELDHSEIPNEWINCTQKNDSYCSYTFSYQLETWQLNGPDKVILHLKYDNLTEQHQKAECPPVAPPPDFIGIILGIAGGIVAVGMLTILLWKTFTTITDRREFARFEGERQRIKFPAHSNPLFKGATTTIQNPIYMKEGY